MLVELLIALIAVTFLIHFSFQISKKYKSLSILVSLIFIIFWSLAGSIPLLLGKVLYGADKPIFVIEKEIFVIEPDLNYLYVLFGYILFISFLILFLWKAHSHLEGWFQPLSKDAWISFADDFPHLLLLILNGVASVLLIINLKTLEIAAGNMPIYLTENRIPSRIFDYARTGVLFSTTLGSILFVLGTSINRHKRNFLALLYFIVFALACYPFWISGARNTVFLNMTGLIIGTFSLKQFSGRSFFQNLRELKLIIILVLVAFLCISVTSTTRGMTLRNVSVNSQSNMVVAEQISDNRSDLTVKASAIVQSLSRKSSYIDWVGRGEILDSHASLYGVITKMNSRPSIKFENTYSRYAKIVGASGTKGYTINPVAALWMNIGIFAPFVAGGYFAIVILFFWCISRIPPRQFWYITALPSISFSSVAIPVILSRSGPEGLWGLFVNVVFLPTLFLAIPTVQVLNKSRQYGPYS